MLLPTEPRQIFVFAIHVLAFIGGSLWLFRYLYKMDHEEEDETPQPHGVAGHNIDEH